MIGLALWVPVLAIDVPQLTLYLPAWVTLIPLLVIVNLSVLLFSDWTVIGTTWSALAYEAANPPLTIEVLT